MKIRGLRFCNEAGCKQYASPGFSKCEPHGQAAVQRNKDDRARFAKIEQEQDDAELQTLATLFGVDTSAIEALIEYIKEKS